MDDLISRQAAIDDIRTMNPKDAQLDIKWVEMWLKQLPSAKQELPEWVQKVEEYRQGAPSHIYNPLAWSLYQTWKEYDR